MSRRGLGKKIQTIECRDGAKMRVKVEIRMLLSNGSKATRYWAECSNIPGFETLKVESIDQAIKDANEKMATHRAVEWRDKILLTVGQPWNSRNGKFLEVPKDADTWEHRNREKEERGIEIGVDFAQVGEVAGQTMFRRKGEAPQEGLPHGSTYSGDMSDLPIDDTRENRIAINAVFTLMDQLRIRLASLLGEEQGVKTLQQLAANKMPLLLTGPDPKKRKGK